MTIPNYKNIAGGLCDILFPRCCPVCGLIVMPRDNYICPECFKKLSFVGQPVCKKCGKELISEQMEYCFDCTKHKRSFESGMALLNYGELEKNSMAGIKYKNKREYLDFYSEAICARFGKLLLRLNADALIPVPIHPSRMRQRGFNQAQVLAEKVGTKLGIPVRSDVLLRSRKTAPQKQLDSAQRLKNLEEAFTVSDKTGELRTVIIADDIYTTGSTIEACTRVLKRAGVEKVYFIAICIGRGQ